MQEISNHPITPTSRNYSKLKKFGKKLILPLILYGLYSLGVTGITKAYLQHQDPNRSVAIKQLEKELSNSTLPNTIHKPLMIISKPGRELAYYLHERRIDINFN